MTENELMTEEVRRALGERTDARGFRIFPEGARQLAVAYAKKRIGSGASAVEVARELGLIGWTLQRWLQREQRGAIAGQGIKQMGGFMKLEVKPMPSVAVVRGAHGVWVEGLGVDGIAALLRSLSCLG